MRKQLETAKITDLYERLFRDVELQGKSNSIKKCMEQAVQPPKHSQQKGKGMTL